MSLWGAHNRKRLRRISSGRNAAETAPGRDRRNSVCIDSRSGETGSYAPSFGLHAVSLHEPSEVRRPHPKTPGPKPYAAFTARLAAAVLCASLVVGSLPGMSVQPASASASAGEVSSVVRVSSLAAGASAPAAAAETPAGAGTGTAAAVLSTGTSEPVVYAAGSYADILLKGIVRTAKNAGAYDAVKACADLIPSIYLDHFIARGGKLDLSQTPVKSAPQYNESNTRGYLEWNPLTIHFFSRAKNDTVVHEFAHFIEGTLQLYDANQALYRKENSSTIRSLVSKYSQTNSMEYFAECFAFYVLHPESRDKLTQAAPETVKMIQSCLSRTSLDGSGTTSAESSGSGPATATPADGSNGSSTGSGNSSSGSSSTAANTVAGFRDVPANAWYAHAVELVKKYGYMQGSGAGTFQPNLTVTRSMAVEALYKAAGSPAVPAGTVSATNGDGRSQTSVRVTDIKPGSWYSSAAAWAAANGIVPVSAAGRFRPDSTVSRQEFAEMLQNTVYYCESHGLKTGTAQTVRDDCLEKFTDTGSMTGAKLAAARWAVSTGMMYGTSDSTFSPSASLTRAQMAVVMCRLGYAVTGHE